MYMCYITWLHESYELGLLQDLGWFSQAWITSKISVYRCMSGESGSTDESPVTEFWNKIP